MRSFFYDMKGPEVHLYPLVCWHLGAKQSSTKFIEEVIRQIKADPLARWIYMGDMGEVVTKTSKGNIYEQLYSPGDQMRLGAELLYPLRDKGLFGIKGNHGCFCQDTEVLTQRGWLNHRDIRLSDEVLTMNLQTGRGEWHRPTKIHRYKHDGTMYHVESRAVDMMLTANHRFLYRLPHSKTNDAWQFVEIADIPNISTRLEVPIAVENNRTAECGLRDELVQLVAWFLTDGGWNGGDKKYVSFWQSEPKQKLITDILDKLGWQYSIRSVNKKVVEICGKKLKSQKQGYVIRLRSPYHLELNNLIPQRNCIPAWVRLLNRRQFELFLQAYVDGNGSRRDGQAEVIYPRNYEIASELQRLLHVNGYRGSINEYRPNQFRVNLFKGCTSQLACQGKFHDEYVTEVPYTGTVWCLTVPHENFLVRRNGKAYFSGNSRVDKESGVGWDELLCTRIGIPYLGVSGFGAIRLSRKSGDQNGFMTPTVYCHHGAAGSVTPGGKLAGTHKAETFIDADVLLTAHHHGCGPAWPFKQVAYYDIRTKSVKWKTVRAYACGSAYDSRSGYAEEKMYAPILPEHIVVNLQLRRTHESHYLDVTHRTIEGFSAEHVSDEERLKWEGR